jgi:hypothetical protein
MTTSSLKKTLASVFLIMDFFTETVFLKASVAIQDESFG